MPRWGNPNAAWVIWGSRGAVLAAPRRGAAGRPGGRHGLPGGMVASLRAGGDVSTAFAASLCRCGPEIGQGLAEGGDRWSLLRQQRYAPRAGNRGIRAGVTVRRAVRADRAGSVTPRGGAV
jgi:hypothetical protein